MSLIPVDDAIARMLAAAVPLADTETINLEAALGRVLADDQYSAVDVPPADNSAMDGFACNSADCDPHSPVTLPLSQRIAAGVVPQPLQPGTAARIFTGAEIPAGADAVVMQEQCDYLENGKAQEVGLPAGVQVGNHVRRRGQDIARGARVLPAGRRLLPQDMGLLASVGINRVAVKRRLRVAVVATGDELLEPGQPLPPGHIYNTNRYTLAGQIAALGFERVDLGIAGDSAQAIETALRHAAAEADCIITSGGVSVGEEDHVKACVQKLGRLDLWKLAIKPGKPVAFGQVLGKPFLGLPGNPASVFVTFAVVARPYLLQLQGALPSPLPVLAVTAGFSRPQPAKRREYLRVRLEQDAGGSIARLAGNQSSGVLSSVSAADGFAMHEVGETIEEGQLIHYLPFNGLF